MKKKNLASIDAPDPAAEFAAALAIYEARKALRNLSDAFNGGDNFLRQCMECGRAFERWSCRHVQWSELADVWPYLLQDKLGAAYLAEFGDASPEGRFTDAVCARLAAALNLPLR